MGISSDGILVFGIEVGNEDEPPDFMSDFEDFDDYLNSISGLPDYGEDGHSFDDQRRYREQCPADMTMHCSYDYPMFILSVRGTKITAVRGAPAVIGDSLPIIPDSRLKAFKEWAAARGITEEPKWILCSMYG